MNFFDHLLIRPILNLLAVIYGVVGDFGVAIILMTLIVRILLWPLIKRQLHQTKLMRDIQPELKRIKKRSNGNKMLEYTMMMELYKEKGIKPARSIIVLLIQLPILIAIFHVINIFSNSHNADGSASMYIYPFLEHFGKIPELLAGGHITFFGLDLIKSPAQYWPALVMAIIAAGLQYYQSRQLLPDAGNGRKLRELMREAANGKEVDQSDIMAATNRNMLILTPIIMLVVGYVLPGAVILYYMVGSVFAIIQQHYILNKDVHDMQNIANAKKPAVKEAVIVKKSRQKHKTNTDTAKSSTTAAGKTVVRRVKAKR